MNSPHDDLNQEPADPNPDRAGDVLAEVELEASPSHPPDPEPSAPAAEGPARDAVLENLRDQLQELRRRFDATDAQIAGYLRDNAPAVGPPANGEAMAQIQASLERLVAKFEAIEPPATAPEGESASHQAVLEALKKQRELQKDLAQKIVSSITKRMSEELNILRFQEVVYETLTTEWDRREAEAETKARNQADEEAASLTEPQRAPEPAEEAPPEKASSADAWSRAIWGPDLTEMEDFAGFVEELNRRLLDGDGGIATLAGQLLVFRQAPPEAKPQLLKDVGEAYYRTRPDEAIPDHPFENALIAWLQMECERAGLPNTIEVVHPGERFDKSRHTSTTRGGAEVSQVFGWIVLTEGGRVYTRASVAAQ